MQRHAEARQFQRGPIILGGCPRSGTSLLLSILSAHSELYCIPEEAWGFYDFQTIEKFATYVDKWFWQHLPDGVEKRHKRWCEKTPRNVLAFRNLLEYFGPDVRLIHVVRDGRDVITSRHPHNPTEYWVKDWEWIWYAGEGLRFSSHPQVFTVRYEDLVLRYRETIEDISCFIGEECTERLLNWHKFAKMRKHSAWFKEVQPITANSIGRWREATHREVIERFMRNREARSLLASCGYLP